MLEIVPNYYHKFKCIADKCTHNCCIGWEIDIDDETIDIYNSLDTEMGERIRENIEGEIPHFILSEGGRCPFLNKNELCDIICEYGEDAICDICYLHPRFKNFYSSFVEVGLGLCCEEAVRIVLSEEEQFSISMPEATDALEKYFFDKRKEIFSVLQNREISIGKRFSKLAENFGFEFDFSIEELCNLYLSLERLDEKWTDEIESLKGFSFDRKIFEDKDLQIPFEQLSVYFIFRHLVKAMDDGDYKSKVEFALVSCYLIGALCALKKDGNTALDRMFDLVRMYSSEVEYSEENTEIMINNISR